LNKMIAFHSNDEPSTRVVDPNEPVITMQQFRSITMK